MIHSVGRLATDDIIKDDVFLNICRDVLYIKGMFQIGALLTPHCDNVRYYIDGGLSHWDNPILSDCVTMLLLELRQSIVGRKNAVGKVLLGDKVRYVYLSNMKTFT